MNNVYLFQVNYQSGLGKYTSQWLPYSIATVWAYAEQNTIVQENFTVKEVIFRREPVQDIVNRLDNPTLCFFSNYIWNENYNILVAKAIKEKYKDCIIVFGGPQVHTNGYTFLEQNSFVTSVVVNEGEQSLQTLLIDYVNNNSIEQVS